MPAFGFRLTTSVARPESRLVDAFRGAATGNVCDALGRSAAMSYRIKPVGFQGPAAAFVGVAFTIKARPVDNLVVWKALELAEPGDVIVIATGGHLEHSTWGDLTSRVAAARGLAAVVTDGAVRDVDGILEAGVPVFAAAVPPNSPWNDGPGEINVAVSCGGQVVRPGGHPRRRRGRRRRGAARGRPPGRRGAAPGAALRAGAHGRDRAR